MARTADRNLRERTINLLKAAGYTNREISKALGISASTVHFYTSKTTCGQYLDGNYYRTLR